MSSSGVVDRRVSAVVRAPQGDEERARFASAVVSYALRVPLDEVLGKERGAAPIAFARQVAMYLAHTVFEMSINRVAMAFGRDRSTIAHACHRIEDRRDDAAFDSWIEDLEATMRAAPAPLSVEQVAA